MYNYKIYVPDSVEFNSVRKYFLGICSKKDSFDYSIKFSKDKKRIYLESSNFEVEFVNSGVGKTATARTLHQDILKSHKDKKYITRAFLIGTSCGLTKGICQIEKAYQDIDLTPVGRLLGESPDEPLYYKLSPITYFNDKCIIADSLTTEKFCEDLNHSKLYKDMSETYVVNMEDYSFCSMMDDSKIPYTILRGISDSGDFKVWEDSVDNVMTELIELVMDFIDYIDEPFRQLCDSVSDFY